jgi:Icc-related predicted phosphoesterase
MRLLLVGDLHYAMRQFDWVVDQAGDVDLVVLAGDHLDLSSSVPLEAQIPVVLGYLGRLASETRVAASSGNHDLTSRDANGEKVAAWLAGARSAGVAVDGDTIDLDDVRVTVSPWWDGPQGRAVVDRLFSDAAPPDRTRPWVWVYHGPPSGSPLAWGGRRSFGDPDLSAWIDQHHPTLVLTGHVHEAPFIDGGSWHDRIGDTLVLNAGRQPGEVPAHAVVDLAAGTAVWRSYEGSDRIELAR